MLGCVYIYIYIIAFRQSHVVVAVVFHQFSFATSSIYVPSLPNPRMPPPNKKLSSLGVDEIGHIVYIWVNYNVPGFRRLLDAVLDKGARPATK